jgi:AcrR family transcriptional regulator
LNPLPKESTQPSRRLSAEELTEQRREEVYHAAVKVFAEHGYRDASIAQIAAEMGAGHGTIYRYFENKRAIVEYVIQRTVAGLAPVIQSEPPDQSTTLEEYREQMGRIGRKLFETFIADSELGKVLFFVAGEVESELRESVNEAFDFFTHTTELYLVNGVERGFIDPEVDTFVTAEALNAFIFEGARRLQATDDQEAMAERWIATAQKVFFDGIGKREP